MANDSRTPADDGYTEYSIIHGDEERTDLEWVGVGPGAPRVFDRQSEVIYGGEIDEDEREVRVDEDERRELDDEETLGDYVAEVGDDLGWTWLSSFAHDNLETTGHEAHMDVIDAKFDRRNVVDDADYDVGFFGSFTYRDDDGRVHTLERQFDVYTDDASRTGADQPVVVVEEAYLTAADDNPESRVGDADLEGKTRREFPVDVDPDAEDERAAIHEFCREWHESHPEPMDSSH